MIFPPQAINGNKIAVDDLSLNMYNDQITVLLGHNGAGELCMLSMCAATSTHSGSVPMGNIRCVTNAVSLYARCILHDEQPDFPAFHILEAPQCCEAAARPMSYFEVHVWFWADGLAHLAT